MNKEKLYECIDKLGLNHINTIKESQLLDKLIIIEMHKINNIKSTK